MVIHALDGSEGATLRRRLEALIGSLPIQDAIDGRDEHVIAVHTLLAEAVTVARVIEGRYPRRGVRLKEGDMRGTPTVAQGPAH